MTDVDPKGRTRSRGRRGRQLLQKPYSGVFAQLYIALILLSTMFANSSGQSAVQRIAPSDLLLLLAAGIIVVRLLENKETQFLSIFGALVLPLLVIFFVFALFVLLTQDDVTLYLVNAFAISYLVIPGAMLTTPRVPDQLRTLNLGVLGVISVFALFALTSSGGGNYRVSAAGTFTNPNHTSAFAALSILYLLLFVRGYVAIRVVLLLACMSSIADTFSFGAVLSLAAALVTGFWLRVKRPEARILLVLGAISGVFLLDRLIALLGRWVPRLATGTDNLERSRDSRFELWEQAQDLFNEQPFGRGLGNVDKALALEVHNDQLTFLAAFGLLGPIMMLMLFIAVWKLGKARTRAVAVFIFVSSFTHDSFSWRYQWLFLSIGVIYDYYESRASDDEAPEAPPPTRRQLGRDGPTAGTALPAPVAIPGNPPAPWRAGPQGSIGNAGG